jgi:hypothetical protein
MSVAARFEHENVPAWYPGPVIYGLGMELLDVLRP